MTKKNQSSILSSIDFYGAVPVFLYAVVFLILTCLSSLSTIKWISMLLIVSVIVLMVIRFKSLRQKITLPFLVLSAFVVMDAISTSYAISGKFALREFLKVLVSFIGYIILTTCDNGKEEKVGRTGAALLAIASAIAGLVSIDMLSTHMISNEFIGFLNLFSSDYTALEPVEVGVRMLSFLVNPNVFAGIVGIGTLLSLGLVSTETGKKRHKLYLVVLYINALSFVLAFSMGASGIIAVAFVLFLLLEPKDTRAKLLILMAETFALTVLSAMIISATSFDRWDGFQPIPILCVIVGAAALIYLQRLFREKVSAIPPKFVNILLCSLLSAVIVFGILAVCVTGTVTMQNGEAIHRAAYPAAGDYTLEIRSTGRLNVTIESQNEQETMMHTRTRLYAGDASTASFTVPEGSLVVYFDFAAAEDLKLEAATYKGTEKGSIPLDYKILPGFMANRLQGLLANENAIQRTVFFSDGMKLFRQNPIVGLGLGSYESAIKGVQDFYYETKYAHNHYIQALSDTGIIGFILFVGVLVTSGIALWRTRNKHPLIPSLLATLVFIAGHAAVEVDFSLYTFLPFAFGTFAVMHLCCRDAFPKIQLGVRTCTHVVVSCIAFVLIWGILLGGNMLARGIVDEEPSFENLEKAARLDRFEWADYMLGYVVNSINYQNVIEICVTADAYAARLSRVRSNSLHLTLADYYFATLRYDNGFEEIMKHLDATISDSASWASTISLLQFHDDRTIEFRDGVADVARRFKQWNEENIGRIDLAGNMNAYLMEALE